jgi:nucleolar complex protein 3
MSAMCCDAIIEVFKNDESGEASLDAVKLITKMIKSRGYLVHEEVLNTFLHLRLRDELNMKTSHEDEVKNVVKGKKRKFEKQVPKRHLSRKMKKLEKERKEVEKEMKEAEAIVDKEEKVKTVSI